jgi:hypothetical protein
VCQNTVVGQDEATSVQRDEATCVQKRAVCRELTCVLRAKSKKTSCLRGSRAIYVRVESRSRVQSSQGMSRVPVHVPEQGTCELQASQLCEFRARCMLESNQVVSRASEPVVDQEQAEWF